MTVWELRPQVSNRVTEEQHWTKDSKVLIRKEQYAAATFECQSDIRPNIDLLNENGVELISGTPYAWSLTCLDSIPNGPWVTWVYPDNMADDERKNVEHLVGLGLYSSLESNGWSHESVEYWIAGPLALTEKK